MTTSRNQHLQLAKNAVRVPETQNLSSVKLWCEYAIWGLLFYDDQSPWLTVVEALHICFHRKVQGDPVFTPVASAASTEHEAITYRLRLNYELRHMLFRDREVIRIANGQSVDEKARWKAWLETVSRDYAGLELGYLRDEFDTFGEMARSVELLRTAEIEAQSAKRWTSRHILPLGPDMLFADVNDKNSLDRKFMRRTGEMLYIMLNRATRREKLGQLIETRLLGAASPWNRLAKRVGGPTAAWVGDTHIGYLPVASTTSYDRLAEDWVALLSLRNIPVENLLDPLERVSGLNQILYILERAQVTIGDEVPVPPFFLDLLGAPGNNPIRKLSANQFKRHRSMPVEAIGAFIDTFAASKEWGGVLASAAGAKEAMDLLASRFLWRPSRSPNPDWMPSPQDQLAELRTQAQNSKGHSITSTFSSHAKHIGMLRAQRSSGTWYAPSDAFLEALVLANVTTPMEFGDFLHRLMTRYNIVIGPEEVRAAFNVKTSALPAPLADLKDNERRLEDRLRVLGFLDRKSDDCAFVINPFHDATAATSGAAQLVHA
ncbi:hypothetical protein ASF41_12440 [Methylobacterium sp. Leaf111]|uniref:hypothetical protein n=1 Tax=Methylobacterium sp. Leaf111 TaxID=1736257 RepID=UPI0006FE9297|nr:hypothetical protein [Methylobacterium sp. Leaf111]KQP52456.1 hypothetical protein ASF41_12440 [Methylobacterium sp. Leaf111]